MSDAPTAPELLSVKPPQWDRALRYWSVVRRLAESSTRSRSEVGTAAAELVVASLILGDDEPRDCWTLQSVAC